MRFTSEFGMGSGGATSLKRLEDPRAVFAIWVNRSNC